MNQFSTLPLSKAMIDTLAAIGYTEMTPIQEESIPWILKKEDVLAQAKTGSGKTAAFGIGILSQLNACT
jgi:ATP-independent RNA helicase DbpA